MMIMLSTKKIKNTQLNMAATLVKKKAGSFSLNLAVQKRISSKAIINKSEHIISCEYSGDRVIPKALKRHSEENVLKVSESERATKLFMVPLNISLF